LDTPVVLFCRFMMKFFYKIASSIFWYAMNKVRCMPRKPMRARPVSLEWFLSPSGPGATNAVTGLTDALMDSIPLVVLTGQVPTFMIGSDAFQEADTVGITRPCTKHNWLVKDTDALAHTLHTAFHVACSGRPGPVLVDIPKDVQFANGTYEGPAKMKSHYQPQLKGDLDAITALVEAMETAQKPIFYTGGGVINSGPVASQLLRELVEATISRSRQPLWGLAVTPVTATTGWACWACMVCMKRIWRCMIAI
jgi:acetolactate synthase-1/2/3 large subunit